MNYYTTSQRTDGNWDYTRNYRPVGYCRPYEEIDAERYGITEEECAKYQETSHKHHDCGHATEEEARECYKQYLLDHNLKFNVMENQQNKCRVCKAWTQNYVEIGNNLFILCSDHCDSETIRTLFAAPQESWSSW